MHPTPAQIAYGSATVTLTTLLLLLIAPSASGLTVALIAVAALIAGVVVAIGVRSRRYARTAEEWSPLVPAPSGARERLRV